MPTTPLPQIPNITAGPSMHVYDVIVVGGQVAGALAATLLAKHGYRVLLIEHDGMGAARPVLGHRRLLLVRVYHLAYSTDPTGSREYRRRGHP